MVYDHDMTHTPRFAMRGFTLIELIIVIVVIATLATVATISYRGVRDNGYNTKVLNGVKQYYEAIETYKAKYGHYPETSIEHDNPAATVALTCLGVGYKDGNCGVVTNTTVLEDSYFNQQMNALVDAPPALGDLKIDVHPESFTGAVYGIDHTSTGGTGYGRTIQWTLLGANADCKIVGAYTYNISSSPPTTACEMLLEPVVR